MMIFLGKLSNFLADPAQVLAHVGVDAREALAGAADAKGGDADRGPLSVDLGQEGPAGVTGTGIGAALAGANVALGVDVAAENRVLVLALAQVHPHDVGLKKYTN